MDQFVKFKVWLNPEDDSNDATERVILVFEDGDAETFRRQFDDLVRLVPLDTAAKQEKAYESLLRGKALEKFTTHRNAVQLVNAERRTRDQHWSNEECLKHTIDRTAQEYFPAKHSMRRQTFYMKYHLYIGGNTTVKEFYTRFQQMNQFLPYFPLIKSGEGYEVIYSERRSLTKDQVCDVLNLAKKSTWTEKMMESNKDPYDMKLQELVEYLERLELVENLGAKNQPRERNEKRMRDRGGGGGGKGDEKKKDRKACKYCNKVHAGKCWYGPGGKFEGQKPKEKTSKKNPNRVFTMEEFKELSHHVLHMQQGGKPKKKKRKVSYEPVEQQSKNESSDDEASNMLHRMTLAGPSVSTKRKCVYYKDKKANENCYPITADLLAKRPNKKSRKMARTSEIVVEVVQADGTAKNLKALLDSGTTRVACYLRNLLTRKNYLASKPNQLRELH